MKLCLWNIRGMNSIAKSAVLKGMVRSFQGEFLFIQETKMENIDAHIVSSIFPWLNCQFVFRPSVGAWGILLVWNAVYWYKVDEFVGRFSVSVLLKDVRRDAEWVAPSVYGPTNANDEADFWVELNQVAGLWNHPWVLGGDFSTIRFPSEKRGGCSVVPGMQDFNIG